MNRFLWPALTIVGALLAFGSIVWWRSATIAVLGGMMFTIGFYRWMAR